MAGIFISYRRDDAAGYAGWLSRLLSNQIAHANVFMDIDSLQPGEDFVAAIQDAVGRSDVLIALIGPRWVDMRDPAGRRRLDDPNDFVRVEVGAALQRGIRVIPALVHGASMPQASSLPPDLEGLARRQAIELSDSRFEYDVGRLVHAVHVAVHDPEQDSRPERPSRRAEADVVDVGAHRPGGKESGQRIRLSRWQTIVAAAVVALVAVAATTTALLHGKTARSAASTPTTVPRQEGCSATGTHLRYAGLLLGTRDLPRGFSRTKTCVMTNAQAARARQFSLALLNRKGRILSNEIDFFRPTGTGMVSVSESIVSYRTPAGAHWSHFEGVRSAEKPPYHLSSPGRIGDERQGFSYPTTVDGHSAQAVAVLFRRASFTVSMNVAGSGAQLEQETRRLAGLVDRRIGSSLSQSRRSSVPVLHPKATPQPPQPVAPQPPQPVAPPSICTVTC